MQKLLRSALAMLLLSAGHAAVLRAQDAVISYRIDAARSRIYVVTHRTGLFPFLGHDHAILATKWSGTICWAPAAPLQGHGTIEVVSTDLRIDTDSARAIAGLGSGPSPRQVRDLQAKVLDASHLDAASHPSIALTVRKVTAALPDRLQVQGQLVIRDRSRDIDFPIAVTATTDTLRLHGVLRVPQSGFGIRPESVAGVVRVADTVDIHFDVVGVSTGAPCSK